jgi:hypothetical protein
MKWYDMFLAQNEQNVPCSHLFKVIWQLGFLGFWSHGIAKRGTYGKIMAN